jgi:hypothetical protein
MTRVECVGSSPFGMSSPAKSSSRRAASTLTTSAELVFCYGNAETDDTHLAADIVAFDAGILEVIAERERRRRKREKRCRSR